MKAFGDEREDLIRNQKKHGSLAWYSGMSLIPTLSMGYGRMVKYKYGIHVQ